MLAQGERHLGHRRARPPPGEADLRVAVLLRGGIPVGGHEPGGRVQILLREGLRTARGSIFPWAPPFLRARGNSSQAELDRADRDLYPPVRGCDTSGVSTSNTINVP